MSSNHEARVLENLSKALENKTFNDFTILLAEGHGSITASKFMLCSNSTYFASFLNNNSMDKDQKVEIKIQTTLESMKLVIKFLYTGKVEYDSLSLKDLLDLLKLLQMINEKTLYSEIEAFLIQKLQKNENLSIEKVLLSANVCEDLKFKNISNAFLDFLFENFEDIVSLPEVKYVSSTFLEMLIEDYRWKILEDEREDVRKEGESAIEENSEGVKSNDDEGEGEGEENTDNIENDKEYSYYHLWKFQLFVNWLSGNPDCDNDFKGKILNYFDINRFTSEELTTHVRNSSLYSDKDLLDALGQKNALLSVRNNSLEKEKNELQKEKCNLAKKHLEEFSKSCLINAKHKYDEKSVEHLENLLEENRTRYNDIHFKQ